MPGEHDERSLDGVARPITTKQSNALSQLEPLLLVAGAASIFVVFFMRFLSVIASWPYRIFTYGEGAAIFGVYKACLSEKIYHDFSQTPVLHVFNFLFYQVYGMLSRLIVGCGFDVLIITRMISVAFLVAMAIAIILIEAKTARPAEKIFIVSLPFAPLIGWWAFAVRPDIGGTMLLTIALLVFRLALAKDSTRLFILSGAMVFLAWSFKQPYIVLAPIMFVFAFTSSASRALWFALLCAGPIIAVFALDGLDGPYVLQTMTIPSRHPIILRFMMLNFGDFVIRAAPVIFLAAYILLWKFYKRATGKVDLFDAVCLGFSGVGFFIAAGKDGAATIYYFPVYAIAILVIARAATQMKGNQWRNAFSLSGIGALLVSLLYLPGMGEHLKLDGEFDHAELAAAERALAEAPRPKLVIGEFMALPWISGYPEQQLFDVPTYFMDVKPVPGSISLEQQVARGDFATFAASQIYVHLFDLHLYRLENSYGHDTDSINGYGNVQVWIRRDAKTP